MGTKDKKNKDNYTFLTNTVALIIFIIFVCVFVTIGSFFMSAFLEKEKKYFKEEIEKSTVKVDNTTAESKPISMLEKTITKPKPTVILKSDFLFLENFDIRSKNSSEIKVAPTESVEVVKETEVPTNIVEATEVPLETVEIEETQIITESEVEPTNVEEVQVVEETPVERDSEYNYPENWNSNWDQNDYENALYWLAHVIYAEAGADYCSDEMQLAVGSVVMNRLCSSTYPSGNIYDVIFQEGQYSCTWNGMIYYEPNERAWNNARIILDSGCTLPKYVVYQADFEQGSGVYTAISYGNGEGTMYFCCN